MKKDFCVNKEEHRIYCGKYSNKTHKLHKKTDVTGEVVSATFLWFVGNMDMNTSSFSMKYEDGEYAGYELIMFRRENRKVSEEKGVNK